MLTRQVMNLPFLRHQYFPPLHHNSFLQDEITHEQGATDNTLYWYRLRTTT